jgi:CMP-N,N'-diacetyllegionaminic acid synthase
VRVLGITCARGGSKGVPGKNIRRLGDKTLLEWTIIEAQKSELITDYVVSTDSEAIAQVADALDVTYIQRPDKYAQDNSPILDAITHALDVLEEDYDAVADLRCTNPFKEAQDIDGCIRLLGDNLDADGVVGVTKLDDHHPSRIKHIVANRLVDFWPEPISGNRQDLKPDAYIRNGSVYVFWADALRGGTYFIGPDNIVPYVMPLERSLNIDTELDFLLAEAIVERR